MNYNMIVCVYQLVSTHPILEHFGIHFPVVVFCAVLTFEEQPLTNPAIAVSSLCKNSWSLIVFSRSSISSFTTSANAVFKCTYVGYRQTI